MGLQDVAGLAIFITIVVTAPIWVTALAFDRGMEMAPEDDQADADQE